MKGTREQGIHPSYRGRWAETMPGQGNCFKQLIGFLKFLFIYLFLAVLGLGCCAWAFSSCGEQGLLFIVVCGLLTAVASLVVEHRPQACGLQQLWLAGSRSQAQQLWCTGLVAPRHVGSSQTRARTHVPCIGRQILNHCTTRQVPAHTFLNLLSVSSKTEMLKP